MNRLKLLLILALMPEEAFGWFVGWAMIGSSKFQMKYPDGLGGFKPESRKSIEELKKAALEYAEGQ